jgi:broad specificity phosphatase PhoE
VKLKHKRIFLARHGESEANKRKIISGQLDTPLSEKGRQQAQWLSDVLTQEQLSAIYATGLRRTMDTAKPVASYHGLDIMVAAELQEIDLGGLQGSSVIENLKTAADLKHDWDRADDANFAGEQMTDFKRRVTQCLDKVLAQLQGTALIVGHRNTNEIILRKLLGSTLDSSTAINIKNKYLYEIVLGDIPRIKTIRLGGESHGKKFAGLKDD